MKKTMNDARTKYPDQFNLYLDKTFQFQKGKGWFCLRIYKIFIEIHRQENEWYKIGLRISYLDIFPNNRGVDLIEILSCPIWL